MATLFCQIYTNTNLSGFLFGNRFIFEQVAAANAKQQRPVIAEPYKGPSPLYRIKPRFDDGRQFRWPTLQNCRMMEKTILRKTLLRQILERLAFLLLPLLGIYLLMEFTYDPHSRCIGNDHHHTMGPIGYVIMAAAVVIIWLLAIILEQLLRYFKKDKKASFFIVFLLVLAVFFIVCFV